MDQSKLAQVIRLVGVMIALAVTLGFIVIILAVFRSRWWVIGLR